MPPKNFLTVLHVDNLLQLTILFVFCLFLSFSVFMVLLLCLSNKNYFWCIFSLLSDSLSYLRLENIFQLYSTQTWTKFIEMSQKS